MSDTSRVVLITAGASGIGRAIAMHFAAQNYHVHVCDVDQIAIETLNRDMPTVSTTCADLTKQARYFSQQRRHFRAHSRG